MNFFKDVVEMENVKGSGDPRKRQKIKYSCVKFRNARPYGIS